MPLLRPPCIGKQRFGSLYHKDTSYTRYLLDTSCGVFFDTGLLSSVIGMRSPFLVIFVFNLRWACRIKEDFFFVDFEESNCCQSF